jgi:hypothetical protein
MLSSLSREKEMHFLISKTNYSVIWEFMLYRDKQ